MRSSRLPGKTMAELAGKPSLWHVIQRLKRVPDLDEVVVATTDDPADDSIRALAQAVRVPSYSGSAEDVLGRTLSAARSAKARTIVQVTGDCPLVEPSLVEEAIATYRRESPDYVSTVLERGTFPVGLDVEVFSAALLAEVDGLTQDARDREHVSLFIYEHPERYRLVGVEARGRRRRPDLRLTLDTVEDLAVIRAVYEALWRENPAFTIEDVIDYLDANPELAELNRSVATT
jgi:spore coat polysaccharide biosynthesis protein SpsF